MTASPLLSSAILTISALSSVALHSAEEPVRAKAGNVVQNNKIDYQDEDPTKADKVVILGNGKFTIISKVFTPPSGHTFLPFSGTHVDIKNDPEVLGERLIDTPTRIQIKGTFINTNAGIFPLSGEGNLSITWTSGGSETPTLHWSAKVKKYIVDLQQVSFDGDGRFDIRQDDGSRLYTKPQWRDNSAPLNRSADQSGDIKFPVGYKRAAVPLIGAIFKTDAVITSGVKVLAKAKGPSGINIPPTVCTVTGNSIEMPETATASPLPNSIQYYDTFNLKWEVQIDAGDWIDAGTSQNRLFATLDRPATTPVYYTVAYQACRNAIGDTFINTALPNIWKAFSNGRSPANTAMVSDPHPDINPVENGSALKYYNPWLRPSSRSDGDNWPGYTLTELLQDHNGQCTSWEEFWRACLEAHGFQEARFIRVVSESPYDGFIVKNWAFVGPGSNQDPETRKYGLWWQNLFNDGQLIANNSYNFVSFEVRDDMGSPGQNSPNPQSLFGWHAITKVFNKYYDPSYGATYTDAADMTRRAISGFRYPTDPVFDPLEGHVLERYLFRYVDMSPDAPPATLIFAPVTP